MLTGMSTLDRFARRITGALFVNQSLASAGVIATVTVAAIVGAELSGRPALAGVPVATAQVGTAIMALLVALLSDRVGRRAALAIGAGVGALGAAVAGAAVALGAFGLLLAGLLLMGAGTATANFGRFTAAEVNPLKRRGRAVATVVFGGTVGSVVGPLMVAPSAGAAQGLGLPGLAGPYAAALLVFALGAAVLALGLRPEPQRLARILERRDEARETVEGRPPTEPGQARSWRELARDPGVMTAVAAMVIAYAVMASLMTITTLHMHDHEHALTGISAVISAHTFGMFAFSVVSGWLTDRVGRLPVIGAGVAILLLSCATAPLSPQLVPLMASLFALGLGWNLCYIGGSVLLGDRLSTAEKARTQGVNDLLIGLTSAAASVTSGVVYAAVSYGAMGLVGAALCLILIGIVLWARANGVARPRVQPEVA